MEKREQILNDEKPEKLDVHLDEPNGHERHEENHKRSEKATPASKKKLTLQNKRLILIVSILALLLLGIIFFIIYSKLVIQIDDELSLSVTPLQQSTSMHSGQKTNFTISVKNSNFWQCNAACKFTLIDIRNGTLAFSAYETLGHNQKVEKSFELRAPSRGSGQAIYVFQAKCHNIKSVICLTNEEEKLSSSILALNYALLPENIITKNDSKGIIEALLSKSRHAMDLLENAHPLLEIIPQDASEGEALAKDFNQLESSAQSMSAKAESLKQLWLVEDYPGIRSKLFPGDVDAADSSISAMGAFQESVNTLVEWRNKNIDLLLEARQYKDDLFSAWSFYSKEDNRKNSEQVSALSANSDTAYNNYLILTKRVPHFENKSRAELSTAIPQLRSLIDEYSWMNAELEFRILYLQNLLLLKNRSISSANYSFDCSSIKTLSLIINEENQKSIALQQDNEQDNATNSTAPAQQELALARIGLEAEAIRLAAQDAAGISIRHKEYLTSVASRFNHSATPSANSRQLFRLATINNSATEDFIAENCRDPSFKSSIYDAPIGYLLSSDFQPIEKMRITLPKLEQIAAIQSTSLYNNPSICCAFGECASCCDDENCREENYPILLLHGHALNKDANPDATMSQFNGFEGMLLQDKYIPFGELDLKTAGDANSSGVWGQARRPLAISASYYYITYYGVGDYIVGLRNDEGMENYAIRLKEIIGLIKEKTGKKKVIIVAHSMGGLVAREYLALFGGENVKKLITINTPHKGVSGRVKDWCTLLGSAKECEDLSEGSIFLSRLNAEKLPAGVKIYAIRSTGCSMSGGEDGDGVVTAKSAYFDGAENFEMKGNCTDALESDLHVNALNPKLFPQTYEIVHAILNK